MDFQQINWQGLLPILIIGLVIAGMIASAVVAARRRKALAAWAAAQGLSFDPGHERGLDTLYPAFRCLQQGDDRYAYNRTFGRYRGRDYLGFDYHYETHSTDSKGHRTTQHHHFSAVLIGSSVPLRPLLIRPEGFFDKVAEFFGHDDIDFESAEFSRTFCVKAEDRRWAYDVLHARAIEFLLGAPHLCLQMERSCLLAWRDSPFEVQAFGAAADTAAGLLDLLPEYLIRQQTGQDAPAIPVNS